LIWGTKLILRQHLEFIDMYNGNFNPLEHKMDIMSIHETLESEKINKSLKVENTMLTFLLFGVVTVAALIGVAIYLRDRDEEH
jgi:hypothetical protein